MKRKFMLAGVLSCFMLLAKPQRVNAQISIDITAVQRLVELKNLVDKAKKQLAQLQTSNKINNGTRMNTSAILETQIEIENLLRTADEFLNVAAKFHKLNDVGFYEKYAEHSKRDITEFINALEWGQGKIISAIQKDKLNEKTGTDLYDFVMTGYTAESPSVIPDMMSYWESKKDYSVRTYGLQTAMQKRKMQQAMTYYRMADELEKKAFAITMGVSGAIEGIPLQVKNKGMFSTPFGSPGGMFDDPFNFDNTMNDGALGGAVGQAVGNAMNAGNGGLLGLLGDLFDGKEREKQKSLLQRMIEEDMKRTTRQQMGSFGGSVASGEYEKFDQPLSIGQPFGTEATGMRITTGERISNMKGAIDLYVKAAELRERADVLMLDAVTRTPEQKYIDGVRERTFQRDALVTIKL